VVLRALEGNLARWLGGTRREKVGKRGADWAVEDRVGLVEGNNGIICAGPCA